MKALESKSSLTSLKLSASQMGDALTKADFSIITFHGYVINGHMIIHRLFLFCIVLILRHNQKSHD